jgi:tetratricopeptide (TPR) repeat protein
MSKARLWGRCLTLAVCLWVVVPLHAARAEGAFERHISEAVRLYEDLEYELALEQLERARSVPHSEEEEATRLLYQGLISADLGSWEAARVAFRSALALKPDAKLPIRISPKVSREFESQRSRVQTELARKRKDAPRVAEARPVSPTPEGVTPVAPQPAEPRDEVAQPELVPSRPEQPVAQTEAQAPWMRRVPVVSMVLLGAGVAAGGTGTVFGLSSRSQLEDARAAQSREDLVAYHGQAQRSAKTANILLGTAGVAVAGAVVTWLLMGEPGTPVAEEGAR